MIWCYNLNFGLRPYSIFGYLSFSLSVVATMERKVIYNIIHVPLLLIKRLNSCTIVPRVLFVSMEKFWSVDEKGDSELCNLRGNKIIRINKRELDFWLSRWFIGRIIFQNQYFCPNDSKYFLVFNQLKCIYA